MWNALIGGRLLGPFGMNSTFYVTLGPIGWHKASLGILGTKVCSIKKCQSEKTLGHLADYCSARLKSATQTMSDFETRWILEYWANNEFLCSSSDSRDLCSFSDSRHNVLLSHNTIFWFTRKADKAQCRILIIKMHKPDHYDNNKICQDNSLLSSCPNTSTLKKNPSSHHYNTGPQSCNSTTLDQHDYSPGVYNAITVSDLQSCMGTIHVRLKSPSLL